MAQPTTNTAEKIPMFHITTLAVFLPAGLRIFAHVECLGCLSYCWDLSLHGGLERLIYRMLAMSQRQPVISVCVVDFGLFIEKSDWCFTLCNVMVNLSIWNICLHKITFSNKLGSKARKDVPFDRCKCVYITLFQMQWKWWSTREMEQRNIVKGNEHGFSWTDFTFWAKIYVQFTCYYNSWSNISDLSDSTLAEALWSLPFSLNFPAIGFTPRFCLTPSS